MSAPRRHAAQVAMLDAIEDGAGWNMDPARQEWRLITYRDWYACMRAGGKPIPAAVEAVAAALDHATAGQMHDIFEGGARYTDAPEATRVEAVRLAIGRMMRHVVDTLERPDGVLHLYSGHDWTVTPLLLCVARADEPQLRSWPPFCSNIAFELWSSRQADAKGLSHHACEGEVAAGGDGRYVRVLYNGRPIEMSCCAPGETVCTLADFKRMVDAYCVRDFAAECKACSAAPQAASLASNLGFNK